MYFTARKHIQLNTLGVLAEDQGAGEDQIGPPARGRPRRPDVGHLGDVAVLDLIQPEEPGLVRGREEVCGVCGQRALKVGAVLLFGKSRELEGMSRILLSTSDQRNVYLRLDERIIFPRKSLRRVNCCSRLVHPADDQDLVVRQSHNVSIRTSNSIIRLYNS